jgi:hypothetical protein
VKNKLKEEPIVSNDVNASVSKRANLKVRWLAGITGCVTALACLWIGIPFMPMPALLILGCILAGRWPNSGKWLMWVGALLLSVFVMPFCVAILRFPEVPVNHSDLGGILLISLVVASVILIPLCDVTFFVVGFKNRHSSS